MKATIHRTATFAWSPAALQSDHPYIATGTVAGALDESFSNESTLEIWHPQYQSNSPPSTHSPLGSITTNARFNRLAWGYVHPARPKGLIAAGLESGELGIWDAQSILSGTNLQDSQVVKNNTHTGPVRGLDFNPLQPNLLSTGAVNGEIFVWDLNSPNKPYSPGARSQKLDEITSLAWNVQVPHVLATSSSSGYTVVWDLKGRKEVVALQYGGGAGTAGGNYTFNGMGGAGGALAAGGRRGMSAVAWHPDTPTRLVTASEDDTSPIIMLWDLRNARAPEKIMTGHDKGVLSVSWCKQDADLLLSCGKDNRSICWNPNTCEIVGQLGSSSNWSFEVQWCPRNPGMLASASFDGTIGVHSLQTTNLQESEADAASNAASSLPEGSDFFNMPSQQASSSKGLSLKQPPKWLRRPISATFGFGGQLVSAVNLLGPSGQTQSSTVHIREIVSEPTIVERATKLQTALESQTLAQFCDERSKHPSTRPDDMANWKALQTLFQADSRDELVALLGFSKNDVASKVSDAIAAFKSSSERLASNVETPTENGPSSTNALVEPSTTAAAAVADTPFSTLSQTDTVSDPTVQTLAAAPETTPPSELSTGASESEEKLAESEATEPSLFGDDNGAALGMDSSDFFSQLVQADHASAALSAIPSHVFASHAAPHSSAAATAGSPAPSSVASESIKNTFKIYPSEESEADKLITRALVLGDFESAVSLCISSERFADALLLAVRGGPELLAMTQNAYFEKKTSQLPYLRLFQSIVSDDLGDIVQNADLREWQEIFVVLCTFAKQEEFANLAEQLGQRLEFQYTCTCSSDVAKAKEHRKNAVLCYLAAGKLEKVAGMWVDEMNEEEAALRAGANNDDDQQNGTWFTARAEALQTFMEKITVFQNAVNYVDVDLQQPTQNEYVAETGARTYKLTALYDRIHEYVELLANQGLISLAIQFVDQTPADYRPAALQADETSLGGSTLSAVAIKQRLLQANLARPSQPADGGVSSLTASASVASLNGYTPAPYDPYAAAATSMPATHPVSSIPPVPTMPTVASISGIATLASQDPYNNVSQPATQSRYAPAVAAPAPPPVATAAPSINNTYGGYSAQQPSYASSPYGAAQAMVPPVLPPSSLNSMPQQVHLPPPPPPLKRDPNGWNDVPQTLAAPKRTTSAMGQKTQAITSPFPNSPLATPAPYSAAPPQGLARGSTPSRGMMSPPPQGPPFGQRPNVGMQSPPGFRPPLAAAMVPPPPRPGQMGLAPQQQQQQGPYGAPLHQQGPPGQTQPPPPGMAAGQFGRPNAGPGQFTSPGGAVGPPGAIRSQAAGPGGLMAPGQQQQLPAPGTMAPPTGAPQRAVTPGAGAGAPPRSATPGARNAAQMKYPPGDRSHILDNQKPILHTLTRELGRLKPITPPAQKRMVDDTERRINLLLDHLNCGTVDPKMVQGLLQLVSAIDARNQQAALGLHLQLATNASGDIATALVGVKMLVSRMGA